MPTQKVFAAGSRILVSILVLSPFAVNSYSQTASPQSAVSTDSTDKSAYNLKAYSNEVQVDIVVQDSNGEPISNISSEHFQVLEDGKPQQVRFFLENKGVDPAQPATVLPEHMYSNAINAEGTDSTVVMMMDSLNTPLKDQMYMRQQMLLALKKVPVGTHIALFSLAPSLQLLGITNDPSTIARLITNNKGFYQSSLLDDPIAAEIETSTAKASQVAATEARRTARRKELRIGYTLNAFEMLGKYLTPFKGRKSVIWFSASFPLFLPQQSLSVANVGTAATTSGQQGGYGTPAQGYAVGIISANYTVEVRRVMDVLAAGRVAVYPVDVRGVVVADSLSTDAERSGFTIPAATAPAAATSTTAAVSAADPSGAFFQQEYQDFTANLIAEHQTMSVIAEVTGGEAFLNTNDVKGGVSKVLRDVSRYYAVSYVPSHRQFDELYHNIRVKVDIPGAKVAYRKGYYADDLNKNKKPVEAVLDPMLPELQNGAPESTQIHFQARVVPTDPQPDLSDHAKRNGDLGAKMKGNVVRYGIDWTAELASIQTKLSAAGIHQGKVSIGVVAYDGEGKTRNSLVNTLDFDLSSQNFTRMLAKGLPLHQELDLPDGDVVLRLAMIDRSSGKTGSIEIPLLVK